MIRDYRLTLFCIIVRKTVQMDSFASGRMKNGRAQFKLATVSASSTSSAKVKDEIHRARMATQGPRSMNKYSPF